MYGPLECRDSSPQKFEDNSRTWFDITGENEELMVKAYSDSDWGGSNDDRRSTSGIMVMINGTPVVYKSRLQKSIALSSAEAEAEYMAMSCACKKLYG